MAILESYKLFSENSKVNGFWCLSLLKLGIFNKVYEKLKKVFPTLDDWPKALFSVKEQCHG
jgi:hypothetical protein